MNILGLNAYHGDVSAALVRDGQLVAAVEEERYRRIKHVAGFPRHAMRACLEMASKFDGSQNVMAVGWLRKKVQDDPGSDKPLPVQAGKMLMYEAKSKSIAWRALTLD